MVAIRAWRAAHALHLLPRRLKFCKGRAAARSTAPEHNRNDRFPCPYLHNEVELTDEREQHIARSRPDRLPKHRDLLEEVK